MSKTAIPPKTQAALWARAAGRCEYRGCNDDLIGDLVAGKEDGTFGFIAHVVADEPGGPRGDPVRSPALAKDIGNLMLLCARHHKEVDVISVDDHPEEVLLGMKAEHERRMSMLTEIDEDRASHVIRFGADIGQNEALVSTRSIFAAMPPNHHPAVKETIDLELVGSAFRDHEADYWAFQRTNLGRQFADKVKGRIERQDLRHLSVFALAPQPLLIELGRLISDIVPTVVHQRHREPPTWQWQPDQPSMDLIVGEPAAGANGPIALKLAISATINDDRIQDVLGADAVIWSITTSAPHNDVLRRADDQRAYRQALRRVFNQIKAAHGEGHTIAVFPALPASLAVETGRVWMSKADLALRIYDQNRTVGGFIPTIDIGDNGA